MFVYTIIWVNINKNKDICKIKVIYFMQKHNKN